MTVKFNGICLELGSGISKIEGYISSKTHCIYLNTKKNDRVILSEESLIQMIELIKRNKTTEVNYK